MDVTVGLFRCNAGERLQRGTAKRWDGRRITVTPSGSECCHVQQSTATWYTTLYSHCDNLIPLEVIVYTLVGRRKQGRK